MKRSISIVEILRSAFFIFRVTSPPTQQKLTRHKIKIPIMYFLFPMGRFIFPKSSKWRTFSIKHVKTGKCHFIFKFIPSSYIKTLLQIVVNLKIQKVWPKIGSLNCNKVTRRFCVALSTTTMRFVFIIFWSKC